MSEDYETEEYEDDTEEEDLPWETFGITEEQWNTIWKEVRHANIDTETIAELFMAVFPDRAQAARAFACHDVLVAEMEDEW